MVLAAETAYSLSDRPRVIAEMSYDHDSQKVTMAIEGSFKTLPAVFDRITTVLAAEGLS